MFCGLLLSPGHHTIELHYETPGLLYGLCLSAAGLLLFLFWMFMSHRSRKRHDPEESEDIGVEASNPSPVSGEAPNSEGPAAEVPDSEGSALEVPDTPEVPDAPEMPDSEDLAAEADPPAT